jgi:exodeoxyribonuclease VII small subunit
MPKKKLNFEESLARLEEILDALQNGDAKLDDTLKLYEEGVSLVRACNQYLQNAEQTVKTLQFNPDGTAELVDFEG